MRNLEFHNSLVLGWQDGGQQVERTKEPSSAVAGSWDPTWQPLRTWVTVMVGIYVSEHFLKFSLQLDLILGGHELRVYAYAYVCLDSHITENKAHL